MKLIFALLAILMVVVLVNTFRKGSIQTQYTTIPAPPVSDSALQHLQQSIGYQTISYGNPDLFDTAAFLGFRQFLENTYPAMHATLSRQLMEGYTLVYHWKGKDSLAKPIVLMAHQDVVPIEETTRDQWTVPPFGGLVKDGYVWGRGTADDKINLIAICEAVNKLVVSGYQPDKDVYLIFGHDEEIGGKGAQAVAAFMEKAGIIADLLLDEGGFITEERVPGLTKSVALIGTSEKGYLSLDLTAQAVGGHSSMPEPETAIDVLSKAIVKLRSNPFPAKYSEPMEGLMANLGPEMPFTLRMAFANPWLFRGLITSSYEKSGAGNAMLHTTIVPTIVEAGIKDNVVPTQAKATVNMRLLPGDSVNDVVKKVIETIDDERVTVTIYPGAIAEASTVTPAKGFGYQKIDQIMKQSYPGVITTPFLMIGATDSRHFGKVASNIIKFSPMKDPIGFHGIDERVSLESFQTALWFYEQLLLDLKF